MYIIYLGLKFRQVSNNRGENVVLKKKSRYEKLLKSWNPFGMHSPAEMKKNASLDANGKYIYI